MTRAVAAANVHFLKWMGKCVIRKSHRQSEKWECIHFTQNMKYSEKVNANTAKFWDVPLKLLKDIHWLKFEATILFSIMLEKRKYSAAAEGFFERDLSNKEWRQKQTNTIVNKWETLWFGVFILFVWALNWKLLQLRDIRLLQNAERANKHSLCDPDSTRLIFMLT